MKELIEHVEKTKKDDGSLVVNYLLKSYMAVGDGNIEDANKYAELALEIKPNDMFALGNMGYIKMNTGYSKEAISMYKKMLSIAPKQYIGVYTNLSFLSLQAGNNEDAISYIKEAIKLDPSDYAAYVYRGEYYRRKGDLSKAEDDMKKAKRIFENIIKDDHYKEYYSLYRDDYREDYIYRY